MENNIQPQKTDQPLNKNLAIVCGTIIVISIIVGATVLLGGFNSNKSNSSAVAGNNNTAVQQQQQQQPNNQTADISKVNTAGNPFVGDANAKVTIAVWEDYQCPFCKKLETETMNQVYDNYVKTGKAKMVYKDWEFLGADSQTLGKFARAVWAAAPGKFWQWHKAMFENQGTENTGWATQDKIMSITTSAIGAADAAKAAQLVASNATQYQQAIDADKAEGTAFGINGTPGVIIGKQLIVGAQPYSAFQTIIDQLLK